jgi:hypothetical protein
MTDTHRAACFCGAVDVETTGQQAAMGTLPE